MWLAPAPVAALRVATASPHRRAMCTASSATSVTRAYRPLRPRQCDPPPGPFGLIRLPLAPPPHHGPRRRGVSGEAMSTVVMAPGVQHGLSLGLWASCLGLEHRARTCVSDGRGGCPGRSPDQAALPCASKSAEVLELSVLGVHLGLVCEPASPSPDSAPARACDFAFADRLLSLAKEKNAPPLRHDVRLSARVHSMCNFEWISCCWTAVAPVAIGPMSLVLRYLCKSACDSVRTSSRKVCAVRCQGPWAFSPQGRLPGDGPSDGRDMGGLRLGHALEEGQLADGRRGGERRPAPQRPLGVGAPCREGCIASHKRRRREWRRQGTRSKQTHTHTNGRADLGARGVDGISSRASVLTHCV